MSKMKNALTGALETVQENYSPSTEETKKSNSPAPKKRTAGRPRNEELVQGSSVQEGLTKDYTRATFIMKVDLLERLKNYAYTERLSIKDAFNAVLENGLVKEEKRLERAGKEILVRKGK